MQWLVPFGAVLLGIGLVVQGLLARRVPVRDRGAWAIGWGLLALAASLRAAPAQTLFVDAGGGLFSVLFPLCMLVGALAYAELRIPRWLVPVGVGVGLVRGGSILLGEPGVGRVVSSFFEPPALAIAAGVMFLRAPRGALRFIIGTGFLLLAGIEGWDALADWRAGPGTPWLAWLAVGVPLAVSHERLALLALRASLRSAHAETEQAARQLDVTQRRFQSLVENASDMIIEVGSSGVIRYANPRVRAILGYAPEELVGSSLLDFGYGLSPRLDDAVRAYREGALRRIVIALKHRDGSPCWVECTVFTYEADDGHVRGVVVCHDVGERLEAERARREAETFFEAAFRKAPSLIALTDAQTGEVVDVNEAWVRATGYRREKVVAQPLESVMIWPRDYDPTGLFKQIGETGSVQDVRVQFVPKGGGVRTANLSACTLELGGRARILWHAIDLTERVRSELALERYRETLEELVEERTQQLEESAERLRRSERLAAIGTLAAGVAHQINNPIGAILTAAEYGLMHAEGEGREEEQRRALRVSVEEAERCGRIVKSILQFSRNEPTEKWRNDLNDIVRRACRLTEAYAAEREAAVEVKTDSEPAWMELSPIEVEQALVNLVRNAIESRAEGAAVRVECRSVAGAAVIEIEDDGRGIAEGDISRVVDPFFTTRLGEGGTGLGLSVAHGVVVDHGGKLEVDRADPHGTRVRIELPLLE